MKRRNVRVWVLSEGDKVAIAKELFLGKTTLQVARKRHLPQHMVLKIFNLHVVYRMIWASKCRDVAKCTYPCCACCYTELKAP